MSDYHDTRARETAAHAAYAAHAIGSAGIPSPLRDVLIAALPALSDAAHALHLARHPDSPEGVEVSRDEAASLAKAAGRAVEALLLDAVVERSPVLAAEPVPPKKKAPPKKKGA